MPRLRRGGVGRVLPKPPEPDPADPETWAAGEAVFDEQFGTDEKTGKKIATAAGSPCFSACHSAAETAASTSV